MLLVKGAKRFLHSDGVLIFGEKHDKSLVGKVDMGFDFENNRFYDSKGKVVFITDHVYVGSKGVTLNLKFLDEDFMLIECIDGVCMLDLGEGKEVKISLNDGSIDAEMKKVDYNYGKISIKDIKNYFETLKKYNIFKDSNYYKLNLGFRSETKVFKCL